MENKTNVFERSYENYLSQLHDLPLASLAPKTGGQFFIDRLRIPLFDRVFEVSSAGIAGTDGRRPSYDVCVLLSKYLLLCPDVAAQGRNWVSFKDFKDSRPLHNFFANEVERACAATFSGRIEALQSACAALGGYEAELQVACDLTFQFDALPMIPMVLLFNDADPEFPAQCTLLFASRTEAYLDAECIAMLGALLFRRLTKSSAPTNGV